VAEHLKQGSKSTPSHSPLSPSRKRSSRHKDVGEQKEEEKAHPKEVPLPSKDETETLLHKIEELEK